MLKKILSSNTKLFLKRMKRKINFIVKPKTKLSKSEFISYLSELGVNSGDTIVVHSSFGYLNVDMSPIEVVNVLKDIITDQGNILMLHYPPQRGVIWLENNSIFDIKVTKSSMGALSNAFAKSEGVKISLHPIKAMSVWGKNRDELIKDHHKSVLPFDKNSPYYKVLLLNSKCLGLGIERNTTFHCCEDVTKELDKNIIYSENEFIGKVADSVGSIINVNTRVHTLEKEKYLVSCNEFMELSNFSRYKRINDKRTIMYIGRNIDVFEHLQNCFKSGLHRGNIQK